VLSEPNTRPNAELRAALPRGLREKGEEDLGLGRVLGFLDCFCKDSKVLEDCFACRLGFQGLFCVLGAIFGATVSRSSCSGSLSRPEPQTVPGLASSFTHHALQISRTSSLCYRIARRRRRRFLELLERRRSRRAIFSNQAIPFSPSMAGSAWNRMPRTSSPLPTTNWIFPMSSKG